MNFSSKPRSVLLAYECGYGLGHLVRLADIARRLRSRGIGSVVASYRLDDIDRFAGAFDRVVQAPVWPSFFASERSLMTNWGPSFATALANMGFHESRYVAANQLAWGGIIENNEPIAVVADFAPGAVLAAKGRCPSFQVGAPFATPAIDGAVFPPFLADQSTDGSLEPKIISAIGDALSHLGRSTPATLKEAVIGDESMPMSFPEFDPFRQYRTETLLPPDMITPGPIPRGRGEAVFAYLPEWMQHNDVLMAALCAMGLPLRVFIPNISSEMTFNLRNRGVELANEPFALADLARNGRVFLHHGGLGSSQIGLVAGVPQVTVEIDMEKIVNGRALTALGVGKSLDWYRLTLPRIRDAVHQQFNDETVQQRAAALVPEMRSRLTGVHPLDILVERIAEPAS